MALMADKFEEWLKKHRRKYALTDSSYKKCYQKKYRKEYSGPVNSELATYGDAVLKLALCMLLYDNVDKLTEKKQNYESDEVLVNVIAKHYGILEYLRYDKQSKKDLKVDNYVYEGDKHKYIATAVESVLGAIFMENKDMSEICEIVKEWVKLIDAES